MNDTYAMFGSEPIVLNDEPVQMQSVDGFLLNPVPYIGKVAAEREWNDPALAEKRFLYTDAYRAFAKYDSLILLGRTGTGKTSILRCLREEIRWNRKGVDAPSGRLKEIDDYDLAFIFSFEDILSPLLEDEVDFSATKVMFELPDLISFWIHVKLMLEMISDKDMRNEFPLQKMPRIIAYLTKQGLYQNGSAIFGGIKAFFSTAKRALQGSGHAGMLLLSDFVEYLLDVDYKEALVEMRGLLSDKKTLILVDTAEEYDLRDKGVLLCTKALISACFNFYKDASINHIWMKISLPSEIYTMLVDSLPDKQKQNAVIIQWSSKALIKMIAIRLLECRDKGVLSFESPYDYKDFYDITPNSYENALKLIGELLPDECPTSLWVDKRCESQQSPLVCPTIHYCIRHTLKKPRELITIFNYLLTAVIEQQKGKDYFHRHPDQVKNYIHSTQETLISGALAMYAKTYPEIHRACYVALHEMQSITWGRDFNNNLSAAEAEVIGNQEIVYRYYKRDIQRVLMESGLVGLLEDSKIVRIKGTNPEEPLSDKNSYRAVKASYEYQVKGHLEMDANAKCVIHPMCYEHYHCKVRRQTIVFPDRFDEDYLIQVGVKSDA